MDWQIGSVIGMYVFALICMVLSYIGSAAIDEALYIRNKYNDDRKTIKLKCFKWLFWRCKKSIIGEVFTIAFIHELFSILLFLVTTALFVVSLLLKNEFIIVGCMAVAFLYMCYVIIRGNRIQRKYKKYNN